MTRAGEEMILELSSILNSGMFKEAAKKEEDKEDKKDKKEEDEKDDKKKDKKEEDKKDDKKASVLVGVLQDLVKLASELDEMGAAQASNLVDDAMRVIVKNLDKKIATEQRFEDEPHAFEGAPWRESVEQEQGQLDVPSEPEIDPSVGLDNDLVSIIQNADPSTLNKVRKWINKEMAEKYPEMDKGHWSAMTATHPSAAPKYEDEE